MTIRYFFNYNYYSLSDTHEVGVREAVSADALRSALSSYVAQGLSVYFAYALVTVDGVTTRFDDYKALQNYLATLS